MEQDIFCRLYSAWKKDGKVIYENGSAYSILSVTPAVPLHSIIITKRHIEDGSELSASEALEIFKAIKETFEAVCRLSDKEIISFYKALKENPPTKESKEQADAMLKDPELLKKPVAYNVGINKGNEAGQIVSHYHIQLFPIRKQSFGVVTAMREQHRKQLLE